MDERDAGDDQPSPRRVEALQAAVRRAEQGEGTAQDAADLAELARWLWGVVAEAGAIPEHSGYPAALRRTFGHPSDDEASADALLRRLLG